MSGENNFAHIWQSRRSLQAAWFLHKHSFRAVMGTLLGLLCHPVPAFTSPKTGRVQPSVMHSVPWAFWGEVGQGNERCLGAVREAKRLTCHLIRLLLEPLGPRHHFYAGTEKGRRQSFPQSRELLVRKPGYGNSRTGGSWDCLAIPLKWKSSSGSHEILSFVALSSVYIFFLSRTWYVSDLLLVANGPSRNHVHRK